MRQQVHDDRRGEDDDGGRRRESDDDHADDLAQELARRLEAACFSSSATRTGTISVVSSDPAIKLYVRFGIVFVAWKMLAKNVGPEDRTGHDDAQQPGDAAHERPTGDAEALGRLVAERLGRVRCQLARDDTRRLVVPRGSSSAGSRPPPGDIS